MNSRQTSAGRLRVLAGAALVPGLLVLGACASATVRTFPSPEAATAAIVEEIDAGNPQEAARIFDTFARASIQRDRVYAELFGIAEDRFASRPGAAADVLEFVCGKYPGAANAREGLVYARFLESAELSAPDPVQSRELEAAIDGFRAAGDARSPWVELASVQLAVHAGDYGRAREDFRTFLGQWDGTPSAMMIYVEDLGRRIEEN